MRKTLITAAIIIGLAVCAGGIPLAREILHIIAEVFYSFFVTIIPFLDLEQAVLCKVVTITIVQILCWSGFWVSCKAEIKIGKIVSGVINAIATLLLLIA